MKLSVHIAILIALGVFCVAGSADEPNTQMKPQENAALALAILNDAIGKQEKLLRQYAGSTQNEAALRLKLAETLQRKAFLLTKMAGEEREYQRTLRQQIFASRWLIEHCEANRNCPVAYLSRGTARKNLGLLNEARADFSYAVEHYPDSVGTEQVIYQLAQMEMDSGEFTPAINHLLQLKNKSGVLDRPTLLEKLSWAYAGTNDFGKALEITRENQALVRSIPRPKVSPSLLALNSAIFYARALENKLVGYSGTGAVEYFENYLSSDELAVAARSFPGLFTKEELVNELEAFATSLVKKRPELSSSWEVLQAVVEKQSSMRRLGPLEDSLELLVQFHQKSGNRIKKDLAPTIRRVEKNLLSLIAEKATTSSVRSQALGALRRTYSLANYYFNADSEAALQFRFNLGTLEYSEKNYDSAEEHLRRVLENTRFPKLAPLRAQAARQMIDIGYRRLKQSIPDSKNEDASIAFLLSQWDDTINSIPKKLKSEGDIGAMHHDIARSLYNGQRLELALPLLKDVIKNSGKEGDRQDAIKLVSATYIEKQQWNELFALATQAREQKWGEAQFIATLTKLRDQAIYGQVETVYVAKKHPKVIELVKKLGPTMVASKTSGSIYSMAASSALELNDRILALTLLGQSFSRHPSPDVMERRILLGASMAEEKWDFRTAAREYLQYFAFGPRKGPLNEKELAVRDRLELLAILLGNPDVLQTVGNHPRICSGDFAQRCGRLKSYAVFLKTELALSPKARDYVAEASRLRRRGTKATVADFEKVLSLLNRSNKADAADTYLAVSILSSMGTELRAVFQNERVLMREKWGVEKDLSRLPKRLSQIKRLEAFTSRCASGTAPEFALVAKMEMSKVYSDFKEEVDRLLAVAGSESEYATQLKQMSTRFGELAALSAPQSPATRSISTVSLFAETSIPAAKSLQESIVDALRSQRWGLVNYLVRAGLEQKRLSNGEVEAVQKAMSELIVKEKEGGVS